MLKFSNGFDEKNKLKTFTEVLREKGFNICEKWKREWESIGIVCERNGFAGKESGRENGAHNMWCMTMTMEKSQYDTKHIVEEAYNGPHIQPI